MLEARGLTKYYSAIPAVRDVSFRIAAGGVLGILGPNGSGKSTTVSIVTGLLEPSGGAVLYNGIDIRDMPRGQLAREIAYVPQASIPTFDFTAEEIVLMGRTAHMGAFSPPSRHDRDVARAALERLDIGELAPRAITAVSGGERQLVLIARALATEAKSIVMDEPTANLDFGNQARVLAQVSGLRDAGVSILLCTHDPDHAFQVADRVLLLYHGRAITLARTEDALTAENLSALYGVPVHVAEVATAGGVRRVCVRV